MSANVPYIVKYLRLVEEEITVYAVTGDDAKHRVEQLPHVAKVTSVEEEK